MERATVVKTLHGVNLIPKPPNMRDRDASFSSYLRPDEKPLTCQPHDHHHHDHAIGSGRCGYVDDSSTNDELSIFDAHKYFNNEVNVVTMISSNSTRVSPVVNIIETERSNTAPEKSGNTIDNTTRYSSASSSVDAYAGIIRNYRGGSFHGSATPTASSEASWNSQSALLNHPNAGARASHAPNPVVASQNSNDLNKRIKASLSKPIWILRRKCPCSGRKSVQVKENATQHKSQVPQRHDHEIGTKTMMMNPKKIHVPMVIARNNSKSQRWNQHRVVASSSVRVPLSEGFTFPVLNANANPSSIKPKLLRADQNGVVSGEEEDQPPRESLEVFQPPDDDGAVERTSDSPRPVAGGGGGGGDDDVASDASSDLFEIESFSTATGAGAAQPVVFRRESCSSSSNGGGNGFFNGGRRRSMDEGSTVTECYAPSEASVEWSVTTAEGCYEDSVAGDGGGDAAALAAAEKWRRKVVLAGCRSEKAVSVGPQPVMRKCVGGEGGQRGATASCGGWKHEHVNVNVSNGGSGNSCGSSRVVTALGKPPLARTHNCSSSSNNTPRMSLAFATS